MPSTYLIARDHLQRAHAVLRHEDGRSAELRHIIEQMINLLDRIETPASGRETNVVSLDNYRDRRVP
jgi:hypothetical protein